MNVITAGKLGYCFGVSQAIEKAVKHAKREGPLYSLGTLAHNEVVVEYLQEHGITPITMDELKQGMNVVITAHGAPPEVFNQVIAMNMQAMSGKRIQWRKHTGLLDCTCPIVKKAQTVVSRKLSGFDIVIFGDPNHQEVIGLNGWAKGAATLPAGAKFIGDLKALFTEEQELKNLGLSRKVGIISQTTKVPSEFADFVTTLINHNIGKLDEVRVINTICPIVTQRIEDTRKLANDVDMMLVVGSQESANTKNLARVARGAMGIKPVFMVLREGDIVKALSEVFQDPNWDTLSIGITAGTSTPIEVVERVVDVVKHVGGRVQEGNYGSISNN